MIKNFRVLLADDEDALRRLLKHTLEANGFAVTTARDGLEAMTFLHDDYDLIVTDLYMPYYDGISILQRVHELELESKVIVITGSPDLNMNTRALRYGAWCYFQKPIQDIGLFITRAKEAAAIGRQNRVSRELYTKQLGLCEKPFFKGEIDIYSQRHLFHNILDQTSNGILVLGKDGEVNFSNLLAAKIFNIPYGEIISKKFYTFLAEDEKEMFLQSFQDCKEGILVPQLHLSSPVGGALKTAIMASLSASYENGQLIGIILIINDISHYSHVSKKAEQLALMTDQARYDMIILTDHLGRIEECNAAALLTFKVSRDELIGHNIGQYFFPLDELGKTSIEEMVHEKQTSWRGEMVAHLKGNNFIPLEVTLTYSQENSSNGNILIFARDISGQIEARQQLQNAYSEVEKKNVHLMRLSNEKNRFVASVSHELRTPLNSIIGFSELLLRDPDELLGERAKSFIERIERNGKRLLSMVEDLLDVSKIEAGKVKIIEKNINLKPLFVALVEDLKPLAINKNLELKVNCEKDFTLFSDENILSQIITNLLGNALKFTEKGSVNLSCYKEESYFYISVEDTGPGIPADKCEMIFEPFTQVDNSNTRKYQGSGLGLTICRNLARQIGAEISVENRREGGTRFSIAFAINLLKERTDVQ